MARADLKSIYSHALLHIVNRRLFFPKSTVYYSTETERAPDLSIAKALKFNVLQRVKKMIGGSLVHYGRFLMGADRPFTQTTAVERELLTNFIVGAKCIVEIGVFEGFTTQLLCERSDIDAVVYGIDPFPKGRLGICWSERVARHYNRQHLASGKLSLIPTLSTTVDGYVPTPVDLVFIDGDHSLEGIRADWAYWTERLARGGIIALHDSIETSDKPRGPLGSIDYFRDYIRHDPRFELIAQRDSLSALQKI